MAIAIISASAGSGKTTRLAEVLERALISGQARPEAILATTFTRTAAAELKERVRRRLLSHGQTALAHRLAAARIGTVNAVCARLVSEFALSLGLSPRLQTIGDAAAQSALNRALAEVLDESTLAQLAGLSSRIDPFDWTDAVKQVVDLARTNGISDQRLAECATRSWDSFRALWPDAEPDGAVIDSGLHTALSHFADAVAQRSGVGRMTTEAARMAERAVRRLDGGVALNWHGWAKLAVLPTAESEAHLADPVRRAARRHEAHPRLHEDCQQAIARVFQLAQRVLTHYQRLKTDWGVIDYADQEALALSCLGREAVQAYLRDSLDMVLVDEFQDTTPIQLAIFLKLSQLAPHSVWVGDQKQAIYGFRGSDPALMDATIDALVGEGEPETLSCSYRSRPELVALTSALFARAFAQHGMPEQRVRLDAAVAADAELGAPVEYWELFPRSQSRRAVALANAVSQLLADPTVLVRDPQQGGRRAPTPSDVAVLCRYNWACQAVAEGLRRVGVPAVTAQPGLLKTLEGRLVLAALRLWIDADNRLAAADLLGLHGVGGAGLLSQFVASPDDLPAHPLLQRIDAARSAQPQLGVVALVEELIAVLGADELLAAWGDLAQRRANLDNLRAFAVRYAAAALDEGTAATPAGFVAWLCELAERGDDAQGLVIGENAVTVCTYHAAKGLEWPITVLNQLESPIRYQTLGVQVQSDREQVDLADPLRGLWIRYWPSPYHPKQRTTPFHQRLGQHPADDAARRREEKQLLRLLYVGWTRARDRLILAGGGGLFLERDGMLALLNDGERPLLTRPASSTVLWAGQTLSVVTRRVGIKDLVLPQPVPGASYATAGPVDHGPFSMAPSSIDRRGVIRRRVSLGRAVAAGVPDSPTDLGEAVHGYFAVVSRLPQSKRLPLAQSLLQRWQVDAALDAEQLVRAGEQLLQHVAQTWPEGVILTEVPLQVLDDGGTLIGGTADMIVRLPAGMILIDHKCIVAPAAQAREMARDYAGQLQAYARGISAASGRPVLATLIHLPFAAELLTIDLDTGPVQALLPLFS